MYNLPFIYLEEFENDVFIYNLQSSATFSKSGYLSIMMTKNLIMQNILFWQSQGIHLEKIYLILFYFF